MDLPLPERFFCAKIPGIYFAVNEKEVNHHDPKEILKGVSRG